jgi:hypothetical protein
LAGSSQVLSDKAEYKPEKEGNYEVTVTLNGCTDVEGQYVYFDRSDCCKEIPFEIKIVKHITCPGGKATIYVKLGRGYDEDDYEYKVDKGRYDDKNYFEVGPGHHVVCVKENHRRHYGKNTKGGYEEPKCESCRPIYVPDVQRVNLTARYEHTYDGRGRYKVTKVILSATGGSGSYEYSINGGSRYYKDRIFYVQVGKFGAKYKVCVRDKKSDKKDRCENKDCDEIKIPAPRKPGHHGHSAPAVAAREASVKRLLRDLIHVGAASVAPLDTLWVESVGLLSAGKAPTTFTM